jgi:hypothetical protein
VLLPQPQVKEFLQSHFEDKWIEMPDNNRGEVYRQANYNPVIVMNIKPDHEHFWATLTHEAIHAIDHIWEMIGEHSYGEVYAHSVGAVIAGVEQFIKRDNKSNKESNDISSSS